MFKLWYNWIISTFPFSPSKPYNVAPSFLTNLWSLFSMGGFDCRFLRAYLLASQRFSMLFLIFSLFNIRINYIIVGGLTPSFYILFMIQSIVVWSLQTLWTNSSLYHSKYKYFPSNYWVWLSCVKQFPMFHTFCISTDFSVLLLELRVIKHFLLNLYTSKHADKQRLYNNWWCTFFVCVCVCFSVQESNPRPGIS